MPVITRADLKRMREWGFRRLGRMSHGRPRHWMAEYGDRTLEICLFEDNPFDHPVSLEVQYYRGRSCVTRGYRAVSEALDDLSWLILMASAVEVGQARSVQDDEASDGI